MRLLRSLTLAACLAGCGGSGPKVARPKLVDGEALYVLRYNPARCVTSPDLAFEVQTPGGWERVTLENGDDEADLLGTLVQQAGTQPDGPVRVRGVIFNDARPYGGGHVSRVLRLLLLNPPVEESPPG
jgi:hypothetical protein